MLDSISVIILVNPIASFLTIRFNPMIFIQEDPEGGFETDLIIGVSKSN